MAEKTEAKRTTKKTGNKEINKLHFGEKAKEVHRRQQVDQSGKMVNIVEEIPVVFSPRYMNARESALSLIESKKYGLTEGDFWIHRQYNAMNNTCDYTGLIISHNGVKKINASLDEKMKFDPFYLLQPETRNRETGAGTLNMEQTNVNGIPGYKLTYFAFGEQKEYSVAEINSYNLRDMRYPFAMLQKRLFDRVVLDLANISFNGIIGEEEASDLTDDALEDGTNVSNTVVTTTSNPAEPADKPVKEPVKTDEKSEESTTVKEEPKPAVKAEEIKHKTVEKPEESKKEEKTVAKKETVNAADQVAGAPVVEHNDLKQMTLEEAMEHVVESPAMGFAKGKPVKHFLHNVRSAETSKNFINYICANGTDADKAAGKVVLDAVSKNPSLITVRENN